MHFCGFVGALTANAPSKKIANTVLASAPYVDHAQFLIGHTEWQELALAQYVAAYDRTITAFGTWGLTKLTEPITDMQQIMARQQTIIQLDADPLMYAQMRSLLHDLAADQDALLAYFNAQDKLTSKVQPLYYPAWLTAYVPALNTSKLTLDLAYGHNVLSAVKNLAVMLCLQGLASEIIDAYANDRMPQGKNVFTRIVHEHSLHHELYDKLLNQDDEFLTKSARILFGGTFGDKWRYARDMTFSGLRTLFIDYMVSKKVFNGIGTVCGGIIAVAERVYFDYDYVRNITQQYRCLRDLYYTYGELQERMVCLARCTKAIKALADYWHQLPYFAQHPFFTRIYAQLHDKEHDLYKLCHLLQKDTFAAKKDFWYSRGDVLLAHQQMLAAKNDMVSVLQALAITDGFINIVDLYSTHKDNHDDPWCLATFIDAEQPVVYIEEGRLPIVCPRSVANTCDLGSVPAQSHMLITGPSGAGKSTYLKMVGGAVSCAHSWTIVPAQCMHLTPFARVCTSFDPHEDISKGISTFMAQQQRLEQLKQKAEASNARAYTLLLIDEPYRGTIEAEAEKRTYQLGQHITQHPYTMAIMACHLQEPIMLEQHTKRWCNKHVVIEQTGHNAFLCTYNIADGPAWWWFNDLTQRMHFVDWLLTK
jgi:hypothetical protein